MSNNHELWECQYCGSFNSFKTTSCAKCGAPYSKEPKKEYQDPTNDPAFLPIFRKLNDESTKIKKRKRKQEIVTQTIFLSLIILFLICFAYFA